MRFQQILDSNFVLLLFSGHSLDAGTSAASLRYVAFGRGLVIIDATMTTRRYLD